MEITLDIGKNVAKQITDIAKKDGIEFDIAALKMLDLGLRVHESALENKENGKEIDPAMRTILYKVLSNNYLMQEILGHVFSKDKSFFKTYDVMTAIRVAENMADTFMDGQSSAF